MTYPIEGGTITNPLCFKGSMISSKYSKICSSISGFICNEIFSWFTGLINESNCGYRITYYDFERSSIELSCLYTKALNWRYTKLNLSFLIILKLFSFFN